MNKKKVTYNISKYVLEEFNKITHNSAVNKSRIIELLISEWIKNKKQ